MLGDSKDPVASAKLIQGLKARQANLHAKDEQVTVKINGRLSKLEARCEFAYFIFNFCFHLMIGTIFGRCDVLVGEFACCLFTSKILCYVL